MKRIIFFLSALACFFITGCAGYSVSINTDTMLKIEKLKEKVITQGNYGYLKIVFPEFRDIKGPPGLKLYEQWDLELFIDNREYLSAEFLGGGECIIPLHAGKTEITYTLYNRWEGGGFPLFYKTGGCMEAFTAGRKKIILNVGVSETVTLHVVKSSEPSYGLGCCLFMPVPALIQDVEFQTDNESIKVKKKETEKQENNEVQK